MSVCFFNFDLNEVRNKGEKWISSKMQWYNLPYYPLLPLSLSLKFHMPSLVDGCGEFCIGITVWIFNYEAYHVYLTSCHGHKALLPVNKLYLHDTNNKGGDTKAISVNTLSEDEDDMTRFIKESVSEMSLDSLVMN